MSAGRITRRLLALTICGVLVAVAATTFAGRPVSADDGYVLSAREMAAVFGDDPAPPPNQKCKVQKDCSCRRPGTYQGKSGCQTCGTNRYDDGTDTPWWICQAAPNTNKNCDENGTAACALLWLFFADTSQSQNDACNQCAATNFKKTTDICAGLRYNGTPDGC
jgi:hypothetical protein